MLGLAQGTRPFQLLGLIAGVTGGKAAVTD